LRTTGIRDEAHVVATAVRTREVVALNFSESPGCEGLVEGLEVLGREL